MIYITCPTCGFCIGSIADDYENGKRQICNNPNTSSEEKENQIQELIKSFELRYCCNSRIMTCLDIVQDLVPPNED